MLLEISQICVNEEVARGVSCGCLFIIIPALFDPSGYLVVPKACVMLPD